MVDFEPVLLKDARHAIGKAFRREYKRVLMDTFDAEAFMAMGLPIEPDKYATIKAYVWQDYFGIHEPKLDGVLASHLSMCVVCFETGYMINKGTQYQGQCACGFKTPVVPKFLVKNSWAYNQGKVREYTTDSLIFKIVTKVPLTDNLE